MRSLALFPQALKSWVRQDSMLSPLLFPSNHVENNSQYTSSQHFSTLSYVGDLLCLLNVPRNIQLYQVTMQH